jgi:hypothetical protein
MQSKSDKNTVPDDLPPRTQQMVEALSPANTHLDLDDAMQAWIDEMDKKHK